MLGSFLRKVKRRLWAPAPDRYLYGRSGTLKVEVTDAEGKEANGIRTLLYAHNDQLVGTTGYRKLNVLLRDEKGRVVGAILGGTYWQYYAIGFVWIDPEHRGKRHSHVMFAAGEKEAIRRGCGYAYLDTFTFQGKVGHYEALGYEVFGVLEDFAPGHRRFFMKKMLSPAAPDRPNSHIGARATAE